MGLGLSGDFEMRFDQWMNYNQTAVGTTEVGGAGFGTAGTSCQVAGMALDSDFFGATLDGRSAFDYRAYGPAHSGSYHAPDHVITGDAASPFVYFAQTQNNSDSTYYTANFPSQLCPQDQINSFLAQEGAASPAGTLAFAWHEVSIKKAASTATYSVDGVLIATVNVTDAGAQGGANILFNLFDTNGNENNDVDGTNLCFMLIDNVRITNLPCIPLTCSANKIGPCGATLSFDPPTVVDACCPNQLVSQFGSDLTNGAPCAPAITRTWLYVDCCGSSNFCSQTVTMTNGPLAIQCPTDIVVVSCTNLPVTYTVTATGNCSASVKPKVAVYGSGPSADSADVRAKLVASGLFSQVDDNSACGLSTPTLAELLAYDAVFVWTWCGLDEVYEGEFGDVLADYLDSGGGVVIATFAFDTGSGLGLGGRIQTAGYLPFTEGTHAIATPSDLTMVKVAPNHPILLGVSSFNGGSASYHHPSILPTSCTELIANWSNGKPLIGAKQLPTGGRVAGLNFFPASSDVNSSFWDASTGGGEIMANALLWAAKNPVSVVCTPPSCSVFTVGTITSVHCVATDSCGHTKSCDFTVTVTPCTSSQPFWIDPSGNNVVINWTAALGDVGYYLLQTKTNLNAGTVWSTYGWATNPPIVLPMTNRQQFFRLLHNN
jgi:hypothetical protein